MPETSLTELSIRVPDAPAERRSNEPVTVGIPFPPGVVARAGELSVADRIGTVIPAQWDVLDRWPRDGSIRWALLDAQLSAPETYIIQKSDHASSGTHADPILCSQQSGRVTIGTAGWSYTINEGSSELLKASGTTGTDSHELRLAVSAVDGTPMEFVVRQATAETIGPLRSTVRIDGLVSASGSARLNVCARLSFFAGRRALLVELTLHNPRRAMHPGGYWELGDPGSVLVRHAAIELIGQQSARVFCSELPDGAALDLGVPAKILQGSSGGEHWQSRVHVNRDGVVPLTLPGYELHAPDLRREGRRATPVFWRAGEHGAAVVVRQFWQNFPKALEADANRLVVHLFPPQAAEAYELQGGEQKTHVVGVGFGFDTVAARPLDWIARPALVSAPPRWYAESSAVPHLTPAADVTSPYETLVRGAIEGPDSFERKREVIDEYGWRHFGDIYADHETLFTPKGSALVSHYNNQYDAVGGFATQFMRSGDARWWTSMRELASHVVDIDIYHTHEDKAAYNGGMFWHTCHYTDADRATHRSYPRSHGVEGGGPSNEQNYSTGLLLYFLLTGDVWARDAVIGLADWVIRMDDGRQTVFRMLSSAPTGLASSTASTAFHGPGRGAGNSIVALLNAFRVTRSRGYLDYAESLVRRCIHPADDLAGRQLQDTERRWSYTVFLQALARYLDDKAVLGEIDCRYAYARDSLIAYARWMADYERPYLERPEILEFKTETWAAQDLRKSEVLLHASRYVGEPEQTRFRERAAFFRAASFDWLHRFETRGRARPVVLLLSNGYLYEAARVNGLEQAQAGAQDCDFGHPELFKPQRAIAIRRAGRLAAAGGAGLLVLAAWLVANYAMR